jgi:ribosomal protein S27E
MNEFVAITCPHCGEGFEIPFDPDEGNAEFVVDCEVCCRPMTVSVRMKAGEVESVDVSAA